MASCRNGQVREADAVLMRYLLRILSRVRRARRELSWLCQGGLRFCSVQPWPQWQEFRLECDAAENSIVPNKCCLGSSTRQYPESVPAVAAALGKHWVLRRRRRPGGGRREGSNQLTAVHPLGPPLQRRALKVETARGATTAILPVARAVHSKQSSKRPCEYCSMCSAST